nr:MAG TPA: hypothetical protein [Caudoviricetes sp.]
MKSFKISSVTLNVALSNHPWTVSELLSPVPTKEFLILLTLEGNLKRFLSLISPVA